MIDYNLRAILKEGPIHATSVLTGSPVIIEALGASPYAALVLDMEHSTLGASDVEGLIRAADVSRKPVIVRVPEIGSDIARVLDAGAAGIIVRQVETAAQAEEVVRRARYEPIGRRGIGAGRGAVYGAGLSATFTDDSNDRVLVTVQIESVAGMDAADEILAVPGIDAVIIGPGDLSSSLRVPMGSPEFWAAVERIFASARAHGVAPGAFVFGDGALEGFVSRGGEVLFIAGDLMWIARGAAAEWGALQDALAAPAGSSVR